MVEVIPNSTSSVIHPDAFRVNVAEAAPADISADYIGPKGRGKMLTPVMQRGGHDMKSLIRYKTKPESADENQGLVEKVYEELNARDPGGVHYATLRLEDGVTFMHLFTTDSDDAANTMGGIAAFAEFLRDLPHRCAEQPIAQAVTVVGSYRMFS
jgi:hypothetical protein